MRFADALARLDARQPESMPEPSLDRIRAIAELLDDPQLTYPTIHVTGTNGKSTAARAAAAVACASGLTTGLYISPHLLEVTERFSVAIEDDDEFETVGGYVLKRVGRVPAVGERLSAETVRERYSGRS